MRNVSLHGRIVPPNSGSSLGYNFPRRLVIVSTRGLVFHKKIRYEERNRDATIDIFRSVSFRG